MKRLVSLVLALAMIFGMAVMLPSQVQAADDGPSCLHWVSGSGYGNETTGVPKGKRAYICYELYADSEGKTKFNDAYNWNYTAVITVYNPEGGVEYTTTVNNDDEFYVYISRSTPGVYTYKMVFSGQLTGTFNGSYTVYDPNKTTVRLAGANRWDTSVKVADEMKYALGVEKFDTMIIASGMNFADALSGSYLASVKKAPILLGWAGDSKYNFLNEEIVDYVKKNLAEGGTVYILGSETAVPGSVDQMLKGYNVKRLAGKDRFDTNLMILREAGVKQGDEILVCTATNFADSLSASATGKPILLVFNEIGRLYGGQPDYLAGLKDCSFTIIGGENAVSGALASQLSSYGKVNRLAGGNRFETSVLVAERYFSSINDAVLAYAWNFPDGLCGGPLAYAMKCPLILTMDRYEALAVEYIAGQGVKVGVVLGSNELISDSTVGKVFPEKIFVK